jgi:hypothetical protein
VDSGATSSFINNATLTLLDLKPFPSDCETTIHYGKEGGPSSTSDTHAYLGPIKTLITDVGLNLLSINDLTSQGNSVLFEPGPKASVFNIATGVLIDLVHDEDLWKITAADVASLPPPSSPKAARVPPMPPELLCTGCPPAPDLSAMVYATVCSKKVTQLVLQLHRRMGHASTENMIKAIQGGTWFNCPHDASQIAHVMAHNPCLSCNLAKKNKIPISIASDPRPPCPGHTIAADPMVGVTPLTRQGFSLAHIFKDIYTSKDHAFPSASKSDFLGFFKYVVNWYADYGWTVRIFRCDMEAVLNSREVQDYLDSKHIRVQNSAPYSHHQVSVERNIQTLTKAVSAALIDQVHLPPSFWGDALVYVANTRGHVPNKILGDKSPMEAITGNPTNVGNTFMFYFGQPVILAKVPPEKTFKFDVKNDIGLYLGQPEGQVDGHMIWLPYYQRLVNRAGATALNITQAQYDAFYSRQTQMLQPRILANTLANFIDFHNLSAANDYQRLKHLKEYSTPTKATLLNPPSFQTYMIDKLQDKDSEGAVASETSVQEGVQNQSSVPILPYTGVLPTTFSASTIVSTATGLL